MKEPELKELDLLKMKVWAVVGANQNPEKYGNMIYKKLKEKGFTVFPVNPVYEEVEGDRCYKNLSSLPEKPEVINMVVAPERAKGFLQEAAGLGIKYVWFQPGTFDEDVLLLAKSLGLEAVQACVLVAAKYIK